MNLNINPDLITTIAPDRRKAYVAQAEISRTRRTGRLARRAARKAASGLVVVTAPVQPVAVRPLQLRPAPVEARQVPASSELEHASARVA